MIVAGKDQSEGLVSIRQGLQDANQLLSQSQEEVGTLKRAATEAQERLALLEGRVNELEASNQTLSQANFSLNSRVKELEAANTSQGDKITSLAVELNESIPKRQLSEWISEACLAFLQTNGVVDVINKVMVPIEEKGMEKLASELCQRSDVLDNMLDALESHLQGKKLKAKAAGYLRNALKREKEEFPFLMNLPQSLEKINAPEGLRDLGLDKAKVLNANIPDWEKMSKLSLADLKVPGPIPAPSSSAVNAEKPVASTGSGGEETESEDEEASHQK